MTIAGKLVGLGMALSLLASRPVLGTGKVYRWVDAQGRVHYGDQPANNAQEVPLRESGTVRASEPPPAPDQTSAEVCERLRERLETYRSAERIIETDSLGVDREFTAEQREQLIARTEQQVGETCPS